MTVGLYSDADNAARHRPAPGPAVESELARDMVRRGLPMAPIFLVLAGLIWGVHGAESAAYGVGIVFVNLLLAAALLVRAARISLTALLAAALGGFLVRMILVTVAIYVVKDAGWIELVPLAITVLLLQLALLFWETRYVSASLAFPGLKPDAR